MDWQRFLIGVNDVLTAGVGATVFALMLYLFFYNRDSRVARAFSGLLACVFIVYLVDLLQIGARSLASALIFLRLQWVGIAFTPTMYLEFSRAIRLSVRERSFPAWIRYLGPGLSTLVAVLALVTDWVVHDGMITAGAPHMRPGGLFYPFALLFGLSALWGLLQTLDARRQCYTTAARRRMTYLSIGFIAPAIGVFPYLLIIGWPTALPGVLLWVLLIVGNLGVAAMLMLMAYSVAFIGALTPDRVIKHRLVRFLLRGPLTALLTLAAFGGGLLLESALGLGPYSLSLAAAALTIILAQLGVELAKPVLDLALYREGRAEVARIQELSQRMLTAADVHEFLENILAAICELAHSQGGFVATLENGQLQCESWCGFHISPEEVAAFPTTVTTAGERRGPFFAWNGHWVAPIYDKAGQTLLGLVGIQRAGGAPSLSAEREELLEQLLVQAGAALEDRRLQQTVLEAFSALLPELDDIQRRRGLLQYREQDVADFSLAQSPEFPQWIHDALSHYWGGPRLTESPLLNLQVVQQTAAAYDGNPIRGLQIVLTQAIEQLRPLGERKLTAQEWLLYNILEMKFLRGQKVREVAQRLALSESDFYRKQRVAIETLARIIGEMEEKVRGAPAHPSDQGQAAASVVKNG